MQNEKSPEFFTRFSSINNGLPDPEACRGKLIIASLSASVYLAKETVKRYNELSELAGERADQKLFAGLDRRFLDGEISIRLEQHVNGCDVYLIQSLYKPNSAVSIDENYFSFFTAVRAFREHGARHITGILPYLAYSRQDKPTAFKREPVTARLLADFTCISGLDRLIVWAPHCGQIRGFYGSLAVDFLDPLTFFAEEFKDFAGRPDVIAVAPDVGASKMVTYFGRQMNLNVAIAAKYRPQVEEVAISDIIGDFRNKKIAIVLDDMISNGNTIFTLVKKLVDEKKIEEVYVGVSHNLAVAQAVNRLIELYEHYNLKKLITTNSINQAEEIKALPFIKIVCLSDILARVINRIHFSRSISELFRQLFKE